MKGKATWKPAGLKAKRWREAGKTKGPANLLPPTPRKEKMRRRKAAFQGPAQ